MRHATAAAWPPRFRLLLISAVALALAAGGAFAMGDSVLGEITGLHAARDGVRVDYAAGRMTARYWSPQVIEVTWGERGAAPACPLMGLQEAPGVSGGARTAADAESARLGCPSADFLRARFRREDGHLQVLSPQGEVLASVRPAPGKAGRFRLSFSLREGESLHGLGLQLRSVEQRGHTRFLKTNADPRDDSGNSHVPVPLLLSTSGYGVLVDTFDYTWWDLGVERKDRWWVEVPGKAIRVFLLAGSLRDQVREYLALTGAPALPPKWGLGFWYRPKSGWDEAEVKGYLEEFRERDLPLQVVGLEPSWQTHSYPCSYVWNRKQWPDPAEFVAWCRARGIRINLWEHAYVHESSPIYAALKDGGLVADKEVFGGLVPDFTLPKAREVFLGLQKREHVDTGVAGYKLDECDGSDFTGGWFFPDDTRFPGGLSGAQMHNIFGYLYARTMHELFEGRGRRSYFLCRANYAGGQAWATCNYSDLYGFPEYVRLCANSGFACTPWCPEVRDISNPADFVRRSEVVFTSWLAMINAWSSGILPWQADPGGPRGPEVEAIFRKYAKLREDLLPYIYAAWQAEARTGLALNRALAVDFQKDPAVQDIGDEYMLGPSLLVAPVLSGEEREVYLPAARWRDWWTGEVYDGPARIEYHAPLDRLPMFLREGGVVPMLAAGEDPFGPWTRLRLVCWPGAEAGDAEVYDDDGETTQYREGEYWLWPVRTRREGGQVSVGFGQPGGKLKPWLERATVEVLGVDAAPRQVLLNGRELAEVADGAEVAAGQAGWSWARGVLRVTLRPLPGATVVARL